jgi:hypothetical protein
MQELFSYISYSKEQFYFLCLISMAQFLGVFTILSSKTEGSIETCQVSISSMLYEQLLHTQIPKAQKNTVKSSVFFALLGSARAKAALRMLMKLTPVVKFINAL